VLGVFDSFPQIEDGDDVAMRDEELIADEHEGLVGLVEGTDTAVNEVLRGVIRQLELLADSHRDFLTVAQADPDVCLVRLFGNLTGRKTFSTFDQGAVFVIFSRFFDRFSLNLNLLVVEVEMLVGVVVSVCRVNQLVVPVDVKVVRLSLDNSDSTHTSAISLRVVQKHLFDSRNRIFELDFGQVQVSATHRLHQLLVDDPQLTLACLVRDYKLHRVSGLALGIDLSVLDEAVEWILKESANEAIFDSIFIFVEAVDFISLQIAKLSSFYALGNLLDLLLKWQFSEANCTCLIHELVEVRHMDLFAVAHPEETKFAAFTFLHKSFF